MLPDKVYLLYVYTESGDMHHYIFASPPDKARIRALLSKKLPDEHTGEVPEPYYHVTEHEVIF